MITQEQSYIERKLPQTKLLSLDPWELEWLITHVVHDLYCLEDAWIANSPYAGETTEKLSALRNKLIKAKDR